MVKDKHEQFLGAWRDNRKTIMDNYIQLCQAKLLIGADAQYLGFSKDHKKWTASIPTDTGHDKEDVMMSKTFDSMEEAMEWVKLDVLTLTSSHKKQEKKKTNQKQS